jgi:CrcB protein
MTHRPVGGDPHPELADDPDPGPLTVAMIGLVGVGGALGAAARYAVGTHWLPAGSGFPRGTFIVNLAGALILGALLESLASMGPDTGRRLRVRLLVGTGFCGGLTTYSTLALETDLLLRAHRDGLAVTYGVVTVVAGLCLAGVGIALSSWRHRRSA